MPDQSFRKRGLRRCLNTAAGALLFSVVFSSTLSGAQPLLEKQEGQTGAWQQQAEQTEAAGDLQGARAVLQRAAAAGDSAAHAALTSFYIRHQEPDSRAALLKWAESENDGTRRQLALRQAVLLDFRAGNRAALSEDMHRYQAAGGSDLAVSESLTNGGAAGTKGGAAGQRFTSYVLPGPLSSFARMAALAPDVDPEDLFPSLARNLVTGGYVASGNEVLEQTEYLKLLIRYLGEARELQALAGSGRKIVIPSCDSEQTGSLLKVLGYRMRGSCGSDIALETVNPSRAFLTIDSGFPLSQLERDLRANHRFELDYAPTTVPILYDTAYWVKSSGHGDMDFLDLFLSEPSLCRLYLGLSHLDEATADLIRRQIPIDRLRISSNVLDFYGAMFQVQNGAAVVPGSPKSWANLTGVSPSNPGRFFEKLLTTDDGWMAGYFDALLRLDDPAVAAYLTEPERMRRLYDALRGKISSPGPARPVFRSTTDLMLLTSGLRLDRDGKAHIPGNLDVWRNFVGHHPHGRLDAKLSRSAANWRTGDDLLEALFALSRRNAGDDPIRTFLTLNDIDRFRTHPLSPDIAARLIANYRQYGAQYRLFAEVPQLSEASLNHMLDLFAATNDMRDTLLRSDVAGSAQALFEIWAILARQQALPPAALDATFSTIAQAFEGVHQAADIFPAARVSIDKMLDSAQLAPASSAPPGASRQARLLTALVGNLRGMREGLPSPAERFARAFDAQELIAIDALFAANERLGKGPLDRKVADAINQQLDRLRETESVHESLSSDEKTASLGDAYWSGKHLTIEQKLDLEALAKNPDKRDGRAALASLLRDSLVGMIYCYYAPPGAEILNTNPLFVRNHDFVGEPGRPAFWADTEVSSAGWPSNQGGRLSGSLISLPYALAQAEQNFMSPRKQQALIWGDLAPQLIIGVTVPGWRNITSTQVRWVALHVQRGEDLVAAAGLDSALQPRVLNALSHLLLPGDVDRVRRHLATGEYSRAFDRIPTSAFYALAEDPALKSAAPDLAQSEIDALAAANRPELSPAEIARTFGTPKPTLTHSYRPALQYVRTFPALMGYSSRILAETWESNNIYYALLADEAGVPATLLDTYVPEWNRTAIESIFAANLEDWPALIHSLTLTGDSVLHRNTQAAEQASASYSSR